MQERISYNGDIHNIISLNDVHNYACSFENIFSICLNKTSKKPHTKELNWDAYLI